MFDVGFSEVLLCLIVALLVLGPDKLPGAVRSASLWIARFRRALGSVQAEFEREIGVDDIRRQLHNEEVLKTFKAGKTQLQSLRNELHVIEHGNEKGGDERPTPPPNAA